MAKTLVNIITEDNPIPSYLFVKEMYEEGDFFLFISAKDTEDEIDFMSELLNIPTSQIKEIVLKKDSDEFAWERMCQTIKEGVDKDSQYYVNLTGGTRFMALAVQQVFEKCNSKFFYVPVDENCIVNSKFDDNINNGDDYFYPIKYRMSIAEYLKVHEMQNDLSSLSVPTQTEEASENMFALFSQNLLSGRDFQILETLRESYRKMKKVRISEMENPIKRNWMAIPDIRHFLTYISFQPKKQDYLDREELEYLTGGWFEEYVYYKVKDFVHPQDIALGIHIYKKGIKRNNELDVVFTKGNRLFVIECKTGVQTERMFNEIVYKACALRESLLGVACLSYIFSLKKDETGDLKKIAQNMDISFFDHECMTKESVFKKKLKEMIVLAKE